KEHREVLGRWVELDVERGEIVDVLVVEVINDALRRIFQLAEIDEQADVVELVTAHVDFDLVVVTVRVLALPTVPAQRMSARKLHLDRALVHRISPRTDSLHRSKHSSIVAARRPSNRRELWR